MKQTKQQAIQAHLMTKPEASIEVYKGLLIIRYLSPLPTVAIWYTRSIKPNIHYSYRTEQEREQRIIKEYSNEDNREQHREQWSKIAQEQARAIQPGVILVASWGYEQTNIDFYKVLDRRGDAVTIVEIGQKKMKEENDLQGNCIADPENVISEPIRKRITKRGDIRLNSFTHCGIWDGRPMSWSSYA